tara:strand:+ start:1428 stop:1838 length:411 start_codon:yes stop_codon:yes gene_type:complete
VEDKLDLGHWTFEGEWPTDCFGFIYQITNINTQKKYIGKKQVQKIIKRPPLKGKKNKRHVITESDWKTYTGSCNELNEQIISNGKDKFSFKILRTCNNKWELSYYEAELQFKLGVLLRDDYYNGIINCRIGKKPKN